MWNYRAIIHEIPKRKGESCIAIHEVYYSKNGEPDGMTADPIRFMADVEDGDVAAAVAQIAAGLRMALADLEKHPPLHANDIAPRKPVIAFRVGDVIGLPDTNTLAMRRWKVEKIIESPDDPVICLTVYDHWIPVETMQVPQSILIASGVIND